MAETASIVRYVFTSMELTNLQDVVRACKGIRVQGLCTLGPRALCCSQALRPAQGLAYLRHILRGQPFTSMRSVLREYEDFQWSCAREQMCATRRV